MTTILIGTTNPDKLREIAFVLRDLPVTLRPLGLHPDLPVPEEDGDTYLANARLKATYYARLTGWPTVGEDSGFEVDALGGEPGVRSARREATREGRDRGGRAGGGSRSNQAGGSASGGGWRLKNSRWSPHRRPRWREAERRAAAGRRMTLTPGRCLRPAPRGRVGAP